jgi:probable F420-dependent oxidoreductase
MREYVSALRAIWSSWQQGTRLDFRGDFYQHTLMSPFFAPEPLECRPPEVLVAAVGERMTEAAGEVADGLIIHGLTTERFIREVTLPALERGLLRGGRDRSRCQISYSCLAVIGETEEELEQAAQAVRGQVAFYASTPAYKGVLDVHGWGNLQADLNQLSRNGGWARMADLVDNEILETIAVCGDPKSVAKQLHQRFGDVVDRLSLYTPYSCDSSQIAKVVEELSGAMAGGSRAHR